MRYAASPVRVPESYFERSAKSQDTVTCQVCGAEDKPGCGPCLDFCPHTFREDIEILDRQTMKNRVNWQWIVARGCWRFSVPGQSGLCDGIRDASEEAERYRQWFTPFWEYPVEFSMDRREKVADLFIMDPKIAALFQ